MEIKELVGKRVINKNTMEVGTVVECFTDLVTGATTISIRSEGQRFLRSVAVSDIVVLGGVM